MTEPERWFVELWMEGGSHQGRIHRGSSDRGFSFEAPALGPDATIPGWPETLGTLLERLLKLDVSFERIFDERLQVELGKHLWTQTFGRIDNLDFPEEGDVEVQIVTEDEHLARLPWVLLNRRGPFLCACGWSVALTRSAAGQEDYILSPSPKMLIVAPEPVGPGLPPTHAASHVEDLERMLCEADHRLQRGKNLQVVSGWDEVGPALQQLQPHLLYYYGHGRGSAARSRLVFTRSSDPKPLEVPVADFAHELRRFAGPQLLFAYINCCQGDAGGLLGAGWQLGEVVPAVVTNRTLAYVPAARAQGLELWRALLIEGDPPHSAVANLHARLEIPEQSFGNTRWMNPVLHRRYARWISTPPRRRSRLDRDPHWNVKLDRSNQFGRVFNDTDLMLYEKRPRVLAYIWYGEEGQGVDLFHQRFQVELQERLKKALLLEVKPEWPQELRNPYRSFADMIAHACDIQDLSDFTAWVRSEGQIDRRRTPLVHVRHEPLNQGEAVKPSTLKTYLEWWNKQLVPCLEEAKAFGLLGISFLAQKNPARLRDRLNQELGGLDLDDVTFTVLDELEELVLQDLRTFLKGHHVALPPSLRDNVLARILEKTGGRYEMTLEELKRVVDKAWDDEDQAEEPVAQPGDNEDDW